MQTYTYITLYSLSRYMYIHTLYVLVYLSSAEGANKRHSKYGKPRMLGIRVVSLARVADPDGLRATLAATIIFSCLI